MSRLPEAQQASKLIWSKELTEFLSAIVEYESTVPEACIQFYMEKSGITVADPRIVKLVALATDKFLRDIICDAKRVCKLRGVKRSAGSSNTRASEIDDINTYSTLHMEDLQRSLKHRRIHVARKVGTLEQVSKSGP